MKMKILNKNSNQWFEIDEGPVFTDVKNETLDSGTVIISNQTSPINIEPYDIVEIDEFTDRYMCIDTYQESLVCVNPKNYRYQISLFSETKQLENIVCPNLKITKVFGIQRSIWYYISRYMELYCPKIYVQRNDGEETYFICKFDYSELESKFSGIECPEMQWNTPTLREVLNDLMMVADCIPIIRKGKIYAMDLTEIIRKDWSEDVDHLNYISKSRSSEDYVSELQVKLQNVTNEFKGVNNSVKRVEYVPFTADDSDVSINTKTASVKTKHPIYKLKSLKILYPAEYFYGDPLNPDRGLFWVEQDLCLINNLITEYQTYITKPVLYSLSGSDVIGDSQNLSLYYTRGTNKIDGFFRSSKIFPVFNINENLFYILLKAITNEKKPSGTWLTDTWTAPRYYQVMFKVEYETLEGCLFKAGKNFIRNVNHERVIIDNQTNSMVDSYKQGFLEYQKANRLGNEQIQINARFNSNETLMKISELYEDCVIYQCQYQYYKNHVEVNALATKNYVLREYFTGVKSKIRSWAIESSSNAVTRHELNKMYCEFSWRKTIVPTSINNPTVERNNILFNDPLYLYSPLISYNAQPLKYCFIQVMMESSPRQPSDYQYDGATYATLYSVDLIKRVVGNSIIFSYGFTDNALVDRSVDIDIINLENLSIDDSGIVDWASTYETEGLPLSQWSYVDEKGEAKRFSAYFTHDIKSIPTIYKNGTLIYYEDPTDGQFINPAEQQRRQAEFYAFLKPRVMLNSIYFENDNVSSEYHYDYRDIASNTYVYKDSQEIINVSHQIEFCSTTTDICFAKEWLLRQKMLNESNYTPSLKLCGYDIDEWHKDFDFRHPDQFPLIDRIFEMPATVDVSPSNWLIEINCTRTFDTPTEAIEFLRSKVNYAWYLCISSDGTNNYSQNHEPILFAFTNIPIGNIQAKVSGDKYVPYIRLYMNLLRSRDKNIYDYDNHYLII